VVKLVPVPIEEPPLDAVYQFKVAPGELEAAKVAVPVPQIVAGVVVKTCGLFTVNVTTSLEELAHEPFVTMA
jgi:hypothetical protein